MKSRQLDFKQILKLHFLKQRTHEQFFQNRESNLLTDKNLNQNLINFKKILQIIFQYHIHNKSILFIGVPQKLESQINRLTSHSSIPNYFEINGFFSTSFSKESKFLFPKLKKTPDLVVLVSHEKSENFLKECFVAKIPVIDFTNDKKVEIIKSISSYKLKLIAGNENRSQNNNLLFIGLNFLFKISKQKTKRFL